MEAPEKSGFQFKADKYNPTPHKREVLFADLAKIFSGAQYVRSILRYSDGMLKMCRRFFISCNNRPAITKYLHLIGTHIDHRLYGQYHANE
jgi:hypothetical protein